MAGNPQCPIEFDPKVNEYHLLETAPDTYWVIYYCPFCGGKAPQSKRSLLFHKLDVAERKRLTELTQNLQTVREVLNAFGEPDKKMNDGFATITPERDGNPEVTAIRPMIVYEHLSKIAYVEFTIYPGDYVGVSFRTKSIAETS